MVRLHGACITVWWFFLSVCFLFYYFCLFFVLFCIFACLRLWPDFTFFYLFVRLFVFFLFVDTCSCRVGPMLVPVLVSYRSRARFVSCRARRDHARIVFASCMFCARDRLAQVPYSWSCRSCSCTRARVVLRCCVRARSRSMFVSCKCCVRARAHLVFARVVSVCVLVLVLVFAYVHLMLVIARTVVWFLAAGTHSVFCLFVGDACSRYDLFGCWWGSRFALLICCWDSRCAPLDWCWCMLALCSAGLQLMFALTTVWSVCLLLLVITLFDCCWCSLTLLYLFVYGVSCSYCVCCWCLLAHSVLWLLVDGAHDVLLLVSILNRF